MHLCDLARPIIRVVTRVTRIVKTAAVRTVTDLRAGWRAHQARMAADPAYGPALTGVVVAACELLTNDRRIAAVVAAVSTAYIAISRAVTGHADEPIPPRWDDGWDTPGDWS